MKPSEKFINENLKRFERGIEHSLPLACRVADRIAWCAKWKVVDKEVIDSWANRMTEIFQSGILE